MNKAELANSDLSFLCAYISEKTGITFDKSRKEHLRNAIATRLQALNLHPKRYIFLLTGASKENPEFKALMDLLTIRESFFFRHKAQYDVLRDHCLPRILENKPDNGPINIWSAGCANGEEAYSIAMVIRDLIPAKNGRKILIWGTDISSDALIQARKGVYSERAVRELDSSQIVRFFQKKGPQYFLNDEIKSMVHFEYFNLAAKHLQMKNMPLWDLIFCRNVIIYFGEEPTKRLIHNFYLSLADEGYFFPGYSETLRYLNDDFISLELEGTFIYQKKLGKKANEFSLGMVAGTEKKTFTVPRKKLSTPFPKPLQTKRISRKDKPRPTIHKKGASKKEALGKIPPVEVDSVLALAQEHADQGRTMEAVQLLGDLTAKIPLCEKAYYLLAMIYRNMGDSEQAIRYLKKAAYLNPTDPVVRLHLADAYKEVSENQNAVREYNNAVSLLENTNEHDPVYLEDFSKEMLLQTAKAHLHSVYDQHTDRT